MKKFFKIIIILLFIVLLLSLMNRKIISYKLRHLLYGDPINDSGLINNNFFNLNSNNPTNVTKGFNELFEYASKNNISYLKLSRGEYTINDTIYLKSSICFDLNGSTIKYEKNSKTSYSLIRINNETNIAIINGKLLGDRDVHDYDSIESTHEWGMGIRVHAGKNINISNLDISNMTGDGIYISQFNSSNEILNNSDNIKISNCVIHNNRRQGISIISGENIEIYNNAIYNIEGTNPQAGIDLEANYDYEKIDNIIIHNNIFYYFNKTVAIILYRQAYNVSIYENEIDGTISVYEIKETLQIENNELRNGRIYTNLNPEDTKKVLNEIYIKNNKFYNFAIIPSNQVVKLEADGNIQIGE